MRKVLLVDDDQDILALLHLVIDAQVDCKIESTTSGSEAIDFIRKDDFDVVVSDYNLADLTGGAICHEAVKKNKNTSYVLLSAETVDQKPDVSELTKSSKNGLFILKPFENDQLVFILRHITQENCKDFTDDEYISVRAQSIIDDFSGQDIYFRLNESKLIKIISKQDEVIREKLEQYIKKGAERFWVKREDFKKVVVKKISELTWKLEADGDIGAQISSTATIHETIRYLGIDPQIIGISDLVIKNVLKTVEKEKKIWELLSEVMKGQGYIYKLAMLSSYISVGIFHKMDWNQELALFKLVTSSLFQDIGLSCKEEAEISDTNSPEFLALDSAAQKRVRQHPYEACKAIEKIKGVYFDFEKAVTYHHEKPDHDYYCARINLDNLGQLEKMFIMSVDFSQQLLKAGKLDPQALNKVFELMDQRYHKGSFLNVHNSFKDLFLLS